MHTNVFIRTDEAFVSMHSEACNLRELLFFLGLCARIKLCIYYYYCDFSLRGVYHGDIDRIVDRSLPNALRTTVTFLLSVWRVVSS